VPPLLGLIQILAIGFVVSTIALIVYTAYLLTHPPRRTYAWSVSRGQPGDPSELDEPLSYEARNLVTSKGSIPIWDMQGRDPNGPVVLMIHGWGSSKQGALKRLQAIIDDASRVIAWDLPGHGDAAGHARMGADEHLIARTLLEELRLENQPIVLFGWSMGAGISLALCETAQDQYTIRGVICEALYAMPITPARAVLALRGMPHRLNLAPAIALLGIKLGIGTKWEGFDRVQIASRLRVPLLLIHGDRDPVSPIADSIAVSDAAHDAQLCTIEGAGHNNLWSDEVYASSGRGCVSAFMKRCSS
jgi:pimeloyl-ACP methyl ester carboxylesterase